MDFPWIIIDERSKKTVPDGKNITEVGIRPWSLEMMMKLVNIGRDKNVTQWFIDPDGQGNIGVSKIGEEYRTNSIKEIVASRCSGNHNCNECKYLTHNEIAWMMPCA